MAVRDVTDLYREFGDERLPPGQRETDDVPVMSKGDIPEWDRDSWEFTVTGAVEDPLQFDWDEFRDLPHETQRQDVHCVTGWSAFDRAFTGVPFQTIADMAQVRDDAVHVLFHAMDGYTTDLSLEACLRPFVLFSWAFDGEPLPTEHGGPLRVITPHRYAYKGAKWVTGVEFLTEPERGYWERRGYSVTANPWEEDRYS
ncbi:MAG: sulfite oxidase-like oxidoreductase [Halodesulfurarchaeum sp.]